MKMCIILFVAMLFLHILNDFCLQGWLAEAKQKSYWENHPIGKQEKYKYDYAAALVIHAFSWTVMTMFPIVFCCLLSSKGLAMCGIMFVFNIIFHAFIDNEKANKLSINLIIDQLCHVGQILLTLIVCMAVR